MMEHYEFQKIDHKEEGGTCSAKKRRKSDAAMHVGVGANSVGENYVRNDHRCFFRAAELMAGDNGGAAGAVPVVESDLSCQHKNSMYVHGGPQLD